MVPFESFATVSYLQLVPLPRKRSTGGATTDCGGEHIIAAYYSFIGPERMKG